MRFLVDNALSPKMAEGLRKAGYDAIHVCDLGMGSAPDSEILARAFADNLVIISADTDFSMLLAREQLAKPSFILLRRSDARPTALLLHFLDKIEYCAAQLEAGAIIVFDDERVRTCPLPIQDASE